MKIIVEFTLVPVGVGVSLSPYVAACERVLQQAGLEVRLNPNGTTLAGDWETVFKAIEACHGVVHGMGCPRIHTVLTINSRSDRDQTPAQKLETVEALLHAGN
jgi:uncharacterized protein (TIGR00106 family)